MIKSNSIRPDVPNKFYNEKKPLFSSKEIIFRSQGCAKVFHISSRAQVVFLAAVLCVACWSFYSYHMYHKSDVLIHSQNLELVETRDAYVDLMTDFMTLHKNIGAMLNSIDSEKQRDKKSLEKYRRQAQIVEEKINSLSNFISSFPFSVSVKTETDNQQKRLGQRQKSQRKNLYPRSAAAAGYCRLRT